MRLEIVSHCWRYTRLLVYQLSSLVLYPPRNVEVKTTVFLADEDPDTVQAVGFFAELQKPANILIRPWRLPKERLFRREIGRNLAALATEADWIWFTDCDYLFRQNCLDSLPAAVEGLCSPLVFPSVVMTSRTPDLGDSAVERVFNGVRVLDIEPSDYVPDRKTRATGGIQIAAGEVARRVGYCKNSPKQQSGASRWRRTFSDVQFRYSLDAPGKAIDLPNVYRILHSQAGRFHPELRL